MGRQINVRRAMPALGLSIPTAMYAMCAYIFMLLLSFLLASIIWVDKVSGVLYRCTDSIGIFDFVPPFVHPGAGDVYYVAAWRVWFTWFALVTGAILLPAFVIWFLRLLCGKEEQYED
jgi:hypothetical protein